MPNALYTESLWNSLSPLDRKIVENSDQPFTDCYTDTEGAAMADIVQQFAEAHADEILDEGGEYDLEFLLYCVLPICL